MDAVSNDYGRIVAGTWLLPQHGHYAPRRQATQHYDRPRLSKGMTSVYWLWWLLIESFDSCCIVLSYGNWFVTLISLKKLQFIQSVEGNTSKTAKTLKMWHYPPSHRLDVSVMLTNLTILMILALSSKPAAAVATVDRWDRQTDGRTLDCYINPAPHTMQTVLLTDSGQWCWRYS